MLPLLSLFQHLKVSNTISVFLWVGRRSSNIQISVMSFTYQIAQQDAEKVEKMFIVYGKILNIFSL